MVSRTLLFLPLEAQIFRQILTETIRPYLGIKSEMFVDWVFLLSVLEPFEAFWKPLGNLRGAWEGVLKRSGDWCVATNH